MIKVIPMYRICNTILGIMFLVGLSACSGEQTDKPKVTVSIMPQKYILEQIVGDKADVECLLGSGANPETYDPTMNDIMSLEKSLAYLKVGDMGFEDAVVGKIAQANPDLPIYDSSKGVEPIYGTHGCGHEHADPHTWTSVKNMRVLTQNMAQAMGEVDKENADFYNKNAQRVIAHLDSLDREFEGKLAEKKGLNFLVWHPSLSYFARDYGLNQVVIGGHENKEVSVNDLKQAIDRVRGDKEPVFFMQKDFDNMPSVINEDIHARKVNISPMDYNWEEQMQLIVNSLQDGSTFNNFK